jgi:TonB family protein
MNAQAIPAAAEHVDLETENDRFKRSFGSWFWGSMITATVMHFMVFNFWPTLTAEDVSFTAEELEMIELPPEIEIPPPPEAISRPATPVMATTADFDDDITIAPTTFEENPIEDLPPPPTDDGVVDVAAAPVFTPMTVRPELTNRNEVIQALVREYPSILRDAGIGGQVVVWFFISETGQVLDRRVSQSSGHTQLDEAALSVASVYRFSPALNRDQTVQVWIQLPITFQVQN